MADGKTKAAKAKIYAPPDDTGALQCALELLIQDESLRADLGARARSRALTFTPRRMAEKYMTGYELAANLRRSKAA